MAEKVYPHMEVAAAVMGLSPAPIAVVDLQTLCLLHTNAPFDAVFGRGMGSSCRGECLKDVVPEINGTVSKDLLAGWVGVGAWVVTVQSYEYEVSAQAFGRSGSHGGGYALSFRRREGMGAGGRARSAGAFATKWQPTKATSPPHRTPRTDRQLTVPIPCSSAGPSAVASGSALSSVLSSVTVGGTLGGGAVDTLGSSPGGTHCEPSNSSMSKYMAVDEPPCGLTSYGIVPDADQRIMEAELFGPCTLTLRTHLSGIIGMAQLLESTPLSLEQQLYEEGIRMSAQVLLEELSE
jgi:hypothetical protein